MTLTTGDRVKFLNTTGGGVVSKVIDSRTVLVLTNDGFEIPTLIAELVRIDSDQPAARFFEGKAQTPEMKAKPRQPEADREEEEDEESGESLPEDERVTMLSPAITRFRKAEEVYLAFVPHDQKWLVTGPVDILMINNTSFHLLYNIFRTTHIAHFEGVDFGSVPPDASLLLDTVNQEKLGYWTEGYLQFLFHKDQLPSIIPPFNAEFKMDGKRLFKEGSYRESRMFKGKGLMIKILSMDELQPEIQSPGPVVPPAGIKPEQVSGLILRHQVAPREAEVDLHIHELVEDPANLEKNEMLDFQLKYFNQCLDSARANHFLKVTFIHGVGNGILRQQIIMLLEKEEGITFHDAPMSKYGSGALEVRIPHN